jgi:VanZ family protein
MMTLDRRLSWLPPVAWMTLIWRMSADSSSGVKSLRIARGIWAWLLTPLTGLKPTYPDLSVTDAVFRKLCHVGEYAILAGLLYVALALASPLGDRKALRRWTVLLTILWAGVDELHQSFVPGRAAHLTDIVIDGAGALVAVGFIALIQRWRRAPGLQS